MLKKYKFLRVYFLMFVCACVQLHPVFAKSISLAQAMATKKAVANKKVLAIKAATKLKIGILNKLAKQKKLAIAKKIKNKKRVKQEAQRIQFDLLNKIGALKAGEAAKVAAIIDPINAEAEIVAFNKKPATAVEIKTALVLKKNGVKAVNATNLDMAAMLGKLGVNPTENNIKVAAQLHGIKPVFTAVDFAAGSVLYGINPAFGAADLNIALALYAVKPNFNAVDLNIATHLHGIKPVFTAVDFAAGSVLYGVNPVFGAADLNVALALHAVKPNFNVADLPVARALSVLKPVFNVNDFNAAIRFNVVRGVAPINSFNINQIEAGARIISARPFFTAPELARAVRLRVINAAFTENHFNAATQLDALGQVLNPANINAATRLVELTHVVFNNDELAASLALLTVKPNPVWKEIDDLSKFTVLGEAAFANLAQATAVAPRALNEYYPQLMEWLDANANDETAGGGVAPARNGKNLGEDGYRWESILSLVGQNMGNNRVGGHAAGLGILTLEEARVANDLFIKRFFEAENNLSKDLENDGIPRTLPNYRGFNKARLSTTISNIANGMRRDEVDVPGGMRIYPYESSRAFQKIVNMDDE